MKGVALAILLVHCFVVFGKPHVARRVKRQAISGFNVAAFRQDQLNLHNHYRMLHGVRPLVLNATLTKEAQDYADQLLRNDIFQHCGATTCNPSGAGESLSKVANATLHWYNEVFDYNYCSFPRGRATTRPGREKKMIFHFTQVVWAPTTDIGIGYAQSADAKKIYVVARYSPPGNFFGQFSNNVPKAPYLASKYQQSCNGVNGGFTAWSQPGACSKTCGKGVRYQTRSCTNPKPSYNGRDCSGETRRLSQYWCNSQDCASPVDERADQCQAKGYSRKSYNFGGANECILFCQESNHGNFFTPQGKAQDGTLCTNKNGVCFNGECVLLSEDPSGTQPPVQMTTAPPSTNPPTTVAPVTTMSTLPPTTTPPPTTSMEPTTTPFTRIPPTVINGGYSHWSTPGPCSKTCGGGISFRTRKCLSPLPGQGCVGPSREVYTVWCNPQPCDPLQQKRNMQCQSRGYEPEGHNFGGVDECYLYCRDSQSGYFFYRGAADPGTPCNKSTGACVDNVCVPMVYEPGTVIEGKYTAVPTSSYWKNIIVAIPNGSRNVQVIHNNHDAEAVVGYRTSTAYGYDASSTVKGVRVIYHMNSDITIDGPVYPTAGHQLVVYALGDTQADIMFKYSPPTY